MSDARWERLERLFDEGIALPPAQRAAWLAQLDIAPDLRAQLGAMLDADARSPELTARFDAAISQAGEAPLAGMRLGPYRLLHELGSGGMGTVFLAERADDQYRQQVAIKLIRGLATHDAIRQLRHERQILAELNHPGIARLLDGGETSHGQPWLAMEFVPGEPLTAASQRLQLPMQRRVELVRDIARAVHYAHQRLIVHRDIKPANVLLREDGRPVLLDFGIAKLVDPESRRADATQPWFTPAYASPEQRRGLPLSTATDVYALGLLLFELVTATPPLPDADGRLSAPSTVATKERGALRGDLDRIVLRATALDPERRYPSAEALADDLQRHLAGRPVLAVPDSLRYRAGKLLRRHPLVAIASLIAVALLAAAAWRLADERDRALQAEVQAQREAATAQAVTAYLVELFRDADPERARGQAITPSGLADRGRERLEQAQDVPVAQRAQLLGALGEIYVNLGQPEKAAAVLEQALDLGRGASVAQRAEWLQQLALSAELRQRFADTSRHYGAAAELLRGADAPVELATALAGQGLALSRDDANDEAEQVLREALALHREHLGPDDPRTLRTQIYLAEALFNADRRDEARALMEASIAKMRATLPPDDLDLISALGFHGVLLRDLGDSAAAEAVFLEILSQRQSLLERDSQKIAIVHNNLGRVYYDQGLTLKAIEQYQAAFDAGAREGADADPSRAIDFMNLASLYEEIGDYARAEPLMRAGVAILEAHPEAVGYLLPLGRQNFGRLLMLAGKAAESRRWLELPIEAKPDKDWAMERGRQRIHLAEWHRRFGDASEARRWLAEAEANLADIGGPESPRRAAIERNRGLLAAADGDRTTARSDLESARARLVAARGERYVGVGELDLELAALARRDGDPARARELLAQARAVLDPVLAEGAPQRARLQALAQGSQE
jgi:tetratricopeptide (TPR) repeat protein/tRNA A-37 threonylcarbamoyl transferase component Bud32